MTMAIEAVSEVGNPTVLATWAVIAAILPLAEVLIRLTLQETGESRAAREAVRVPDTYRAAPDGLAASEAAR